MHVTKNYSTDGGDTLVIGGKLQIDEGAEVSGLSGGEPHPETDFTPAANQAASEATTIAALKEDFNSLLSKLKTAGLMAADV